MKIFIASDHAGYALKASIILSLQANYQIEDCGTHSEEKVDYPDYAHTVCQHMQTHKNSMGILLCGSGIGMSIAANRSPHIRAALCDTEKRTILARCHNDANVLCLGARFITSDEAVRCALAFLNTPFEEGRHLLRLQKLNTLTC